MKINFFMLIIALIISGLIFYGFYIYLPDLVISIGSGIASFIMLATTMGVTFNTSSRSSSMVKVVSGIFLPLLLVLDIIFAVFRISHPVFIITNGICLCIWAIIIYNIAKSNQ